jgi:hypothetical protein
MSDWRGFFGTTQEVSIGNPSAMIAAGIEIDTGRFTGRTQPDSIVKNGGCVFR